MSKIICYICNKELGLNRYKLKKENGWICPNCVKKAGGVLNLSPGKDTINDIKERIKKINNGEQIESDFTKAKEELKNSTTEIKENVNEAKENIKDLKRILSNNNDGPLTSELICPNCNSHNISIQIINEQQLKTKHHGIIWWICVGWWWIPIKWIFLTIPALLAAIFIGKRKKIVNKTVKKGVCQQCGTVFNIK